MPAHSSLFSSYWYVLQWEYHPISGAWQKYYEYRNIDCPINSADRVKLDVISCQLTRDCFTGDITGCIYLAHFFSENCEYKNKFWIYHGEIWMMDINYRLSQAETLFSFWHGTLSIRSNLGICSYHLKNSTSTLAHILSYILSWFPMYWYIPL